MKRNLLFFAAGIVTVEAVSVNYSPALGTLPDAQGFTRIETAGHPAATVSGGVLHQFLRSGDSTQFWYDSTLPLDFTTGTFVMQADLHIITSEYNPNISGGNQRSGYYLGSIDNFGRQFYVGISSGGITINTDGALHAGQGVPLTAFNSIDGFHNYRLVVSSGVGSLFIDNNLFASTPVGSILPSAVGVPYRAVFGDGAGLTGSQADLTRFSAEYITGVPDNGSNLVLLGGTLVSCLYLKRRVVTYRW